MLIAIAFPNSRPVNAALVNCPDHQFYNLYGASGHVVQPRRRVQGVAEPGLILTPPAKGTSDPKALERDEGRGLPGASLPAGPFVVVGEGR